MTDERLRRRMERDNDLVRPLALRANDLRYYYRKWIEEEVKELQIDLLQLIPQSTGQTRSGLEVKQARCHQIASDELRQHIDFLESCVEDLKNGASTDLVQDMFQLEDGINYLRGLVREIRDMRTSIDDILEDDEPEQPTI